MEKVSTLALILLALSSAASGQQWDYIRDFTDCENQNNRYWLMPPSTPTYLKLLCHSANNPNTRLVAIETKNENDCLIKYINSEMDTTTPMQFLIGYEEVHDEGVWTWDRVPMEQNYHPDFEHWDLNSPSGGTGVDCAIMTVGEDLASSGRWSDVSCYNPSVTYMAICEEAYD